MIERREATAPRFMAAGLFVHRLERFHSYGVRESGVIRGEFGDAQDREHAGDCRKLARRAASPSHRDMLLNMAATWESLAEDRINSVARQERIANLETVARMKFG